MSRSADLPVGFQVRIRDEVRRLDGGGILVGGQPLRVVRLTPQGSALLRHDRVRVTDGASQLLARRLLRADLAEPVLAGAGVPASELTVVVPVRDRPEQLDRALAGMGPTCRRLVVDDGSRDPGAVADVAARHGAALHALAVNGGPAAARNAGLGQVSTRYVAFVDSDVTVPAGTLLSLCRHFADPGVALVAPAVRSRSRAQQPRWFERYDERSSSLSLGTRASSVGPTSRVGWVPSACLVGRVELLGGGFTEAMRVAEDVDLVWRLVADGHLVRYDPSLVAEHDTRSTLAGWLGRKVVYGTGGADLARRHGDLGAPAVLTPEVAAAAAALLLRRRWSVPVAVACQARTVLRVRDALPEMPRPGTLAVRLCARGVGWAVRQETGLLLRHWWPVSLVGALCSRDVRRVLVSALVVDLVVDDRGARTASALVARRLDDLAYGLGLWVGAVRARSPRALAVRWTGRPRADGPAVASPHTHQ